jgi:CheY-like chemotaxis protein/anti-anti-sigma regulatory factor
LPEIQKRAFFAKHFLTCALRPSANAADPNAAPEADATMEKKPQTVLVIDDESATLTMFNLFLKAFGFDVLLAENGHAAMDLVRSHRPEIVFTDLKMPEMDGFQVLKEIKRFAPQTEVIVITGHGDMDLVLQALNLEATDFINKPIKKSSLEAALQRALDRLRNPMSSDCTIDYALQGGVANITIGGTLSREKREELKACCLRARNDAAQGILFTFTANAAVNGTGIAELINNLAAINQEKRPAAVVGLSENFKSIFEMVGVTRFASLHDTQAQALQKVTPPTTG